MDSQDPSLLSFAVDLSSDAELGDIYRFQITAETEGGLSQRSETVAAAVASLPSKPPAPPSTDYSREQNGLFIEVTSLDTSDQLNGGASILLYELQYDNRKGGVFLHSVNTLALQIILHNTNLSEEYRVRYRAKNFNGWGEYSEIALLTYATYPSAPVDLSYVSSDATSVSVVVSPPYNSGGVPILNYQIWSDTVQATDSYTLLKQGNQLLFSVSTSDGLSQGQRYRLKARAENQVGFSSQFSNQLYIGIGTLPDAPTTSPSKVSFNSPSRALTLQWTAVTTTLPQLPVTDYSLYVAAGLYTSVFSKIYSGSGLQSTAVNLTLGSAYKFYYTVNNTNGESKASPISTFYACDPPSSVQRLKVTQTTKTSISLEWEQPQTNNCAILSYTVLRDDGNGGEIDTEVPGISNRPELRQASITGLTPTGNIFRFSLIATNAAGNGTSPSISVMLASVPDSPLSGPTGVLEETNLQQISLQFEALEDAQNGGSTIEIYSLEVLIEEEWRTLMTRLRTNFVWIIDVGFTPGDYFAFRYRARNVNGWGGYSPISYIQAATAPSPPDQPELKQVTDSATTLVLRSSNSDNGAAVDAYYLEKASLGDSAFTEISGSHSVGDVSYTYETGEAGSILRFRTRSHNKFGNSSYSEELVLALGQPPTLETTKLSLSSQSAYQFEISWEAANETALPVLGYRLRVNSAYGGLPTLTLYDGLYFPNVLSFSIPYFNFEKGSSYSFQTTPVNFNGEGTPSDISTFIICSPMSGLAGPNFIKGNTTHMEIEWKLPEEMGGCSLKSWYLKLNAGDGTDPSTAVSEVENIPHLTHTILSFADDGTDAGKSFKMQLSVQNEADQVLISEIVEYTLSGVPGSPSEGPAQNKTKSSLNALFFDLEAITNNGGSQLISYEAQVYVLNRWRSMLSESLLTEFYYRDTNGLEIGKIYMTRYRGININGNGGWSPITYATYGTVPLNPLIPTLIQTTNSSIAVGISHPHDTNVPADGGSLILSYRLEIQHYNDDGVSVSTWQSVSSYPPSAVINNPAQIPLSHNLTDTDDTIVQGKVYRIRSYAKNEFGESLASPVLEALAQSPLPQMSKIVKLESTKTSIQIQWSLITGYVIKGYEIFRDGSSYYNATIQESKLNVTNLRKGESYDFAIRGISFNDEEVLSEPAELFACFTPQFNTPIFVDVNRESLEIVVNWELTSVDDGGCRISQFEVYVDDGAGGEYTKRGSSILDSRPDIRYLTVGGFSSQDEGKHYKVKVRAINSAGYSDSELMSVIMGAGPEAIISIGLNSTD